MKKLKILVADDEFRIRKLVSDFFIREGYDVIEAEDGNEAAQLAAKEPKPDLIILDIMMPEKDGYAVLDELRRVSDIPVIILTARGSEGDQLIGFKLGADDYITKPFSPSVLVARAKALLRRRGKIADKRIKFRDIFVDEIAHMVYLGEQPVDVTPKEYDLLIFFLENKGVALSREKILNGVWNYDYFGDLRTVDTHVKQLRAKLGGSGRYIKTVRGIGYRFEVN
jgi:DNA-binding response OmpR family regulator